VSHEIIQTLPDGRNTITAPTIPLPIPPNKSHKVLFVGAPVKIRETPELAESEAFIPYTTRMTPIISKAIPIPLFIIVPFNCLFNCDYPPNESLSLIVGEVM
jgi:hypothetical protein